MHGGDYIEVLEVERMEEEISRLQAIRSDNPDDEKRLRKFEEQMRELVACSLEMKKPIVF
jgi:hypothetical protein